MEETVRRVKPRQRAMFEEEGNLEFFQVPGLYRGREIGSFLSVRAYIEGKLGIFPSSSLYKGGPRAYIVGGLGIFEVTEPI